MPRRHPARPQRPPHGGQGRHGHPGRDVRGIRRDAGQQRGPGPAVLQDHAGPRRGQGELALALRSRPGRRTRVPFARAGPRRPHRDHGREDPRARRRLGRGPARGLPRPRPEGGARAVPVERPDGDPCRGERQGERSAERSRLAARLLDGRDVRRSARGAHASLLGARLEFGPGREQVSVSGGRPAADRRPGAAARRARHVLRDGPVGGRAEGRTARAGRVGPRRRRPSSLRLGRDERSRARRRVARPGGRPPRQRDRRARARHPRGGRGRPRGRRRDGHSPRQAHRRDLPRRRGIAEAAGGGTRDRTPRLGPDQSREDAMSPAVRMVLVVFGVLAVALGTAAGLVWLERRLLSFWQERYGPNRVGPFGIFQVLADMIKLFLKEDWVPPFADRPVFVLAPAIIITAVLLTFAVIPFAPGLFVADLNIGLLFFLAMSSLAVYSVILGAWASNNKYALLGGLRAAAQMMSYE